MVSPGTVRQLDVVRDVTVEGDRLTIASTDSDVVASALLGQPGARDLEIVTGSLASAFIALTHQTDIVDRETAV